MVEVPSSNLGSPTKILKADLIVGFFMPGIYALALEKLFRTATLYINSPNEIHPARLNPAR